MLFGVITTVKVRFETWKPYKNTCFPTSGSRRKEVQQQRILNARSSKVTDCTVDIGESDLVIPDLRRKPSTVWIQPLAALLQVPQGGAAPAEPWLPASGQHAGKHICDVAPSPLSSLLYKLRRNIGLASGEGP